MTADDLAAIKAEHCAGDVDDNGDTVCDWCRDSWPCTPWRLADRALTAEAKVVRVEETLRWQESRKRSVIAVNKVWAAIQEEDEQ